MAMSPQEGTHRLLQAEHEIVGLDSRLTQLNGELRRAEGLISHVPGHQRGLQRHSREIKALRAQVEQLIRDRAVNGTTDERKLQEVSEPVKKLMGDLALLTTQVAEHEKHLQDHDDLFTELKRGNEERDGRVAIIGTSVARAHARIDVIDQDRGLNPIVLIIALVAAIGGGIFMATYDWSSVVEKADGSTITTGNPGLDSGLGIGLGALVAFMVVIAFGYLASGFGRGDEGSSTSTASASASSGAMVRTQNSDEPPTAVYPVLPPPPPPPAPRADAGQPVG